MNEDVIRTPGALADDAAELIRAINHQTFAAGDTAGYVTPADVDSLIAGLEALASRLPQALEQAREWLKREYEAGRVVDVRADSSARATVMTAYGRINDAERRAHELNEALSRVRGDTSNLAGTDLT